MLNENIILSMVKDYTNRNNEISAERYIDLVSELEEEEVAEVLEILNKNNIIVVEDLVEEELYTGGYRQLQNLSNEELCVMYQRGDQIALEALYANTRRLIYTIASKVMREYAPDTLTEDDLVNEGSLGLITAAQKFRSELGNKFSTYAVWWIRQAVTREVMNHGYGMRLPVHIFEQVIRVNKVRNALHGGTAEEIREKLINDYHTVYTVEKVNELIFFADKYLNTASLNQTIGGDEGDTELVDMIADERPTVEDKVFERMNSEIIENVLYTLSDREREVIQMRFGLSGYNAMTLEEVGSKFGVTRERIRQIETKALRKLRHPSRSKQLRGIYAA